MTNTIYLGASLSKDDGVMQNELFTARPTDLITALKEKFPLIDCLFVPVTELTVAKLEIALAGTARNVAFLQTKRHV